MNIIDIQWRAYRLPFLHGFSTAHSLSTVREGIIVQVTTDQGITGIGEIAPLVDTTFTAAHPVGATFMVARAGGNLTDAFALLPTLATQLHHKTLHEALDLVRTPVSPVGAGEAWRRVGTLGSPPSSLVGSPSQENNTQTTTASTICGLEIAILDALGKTEGHTLSTLLSPSGFIPRTAVPVNAVIGAKDTQATIAAALTAKNNGFNCIKLKVGASHSAAHSAQMHYAHAEIERIAAVRDAIGPAMHLRLDANEAWNLEQAITILSQCVQYDIQYVEQPLNACDLEGMRTLRQTVPIPLAADEAVRSLESARLVLDSQAADILVIKPQLAGGLHVTQQIIQAASENGVRSVITSTIEAGIGLVAALHLAAASPTVTFECGLATLHLLVDDLLIDDLPIHDGFLTVPTDPGLGVTLDRQALDTYSMRDLT